MIISAVIRGDATLLCVVYHCCCVYKHTLFSVISLCVGIFLFFFPSKVQLGNQIIVTHTTNKYTKRRYRRIYSCFDLQLCWEIALNPSNPIAHKSARM